MDLRLFLSGWLRAPRHVGAVMPSGSALAAALAGQVPHPGTAWVVELGPGTGVVTRALLQRGVAPSRLILVEREPSFCRVLRQRFPGVRVLHGDARRLRRLLAGEGVQRVDAVISGLPLLSLGPRAQHAILREGVAVLAPGGAFAQFTYGPLSPVPTRALQRLGLVAQRVARVWRNMPPATVWRYRRAAPAAGQQLAA